MHLISRKDYLAFGAVIGFVSGAAAAGAMAQTAANVKKVALVILAVVCVGLAIASFAAWNSPNSIDCLSLIYNFLNLSGAKIVDVVIQLSKDILKDLVKDFFR